MIRCVYGHITPQMMPAMTMSKPRTMAMRLNGLIGAPRTKNASETEAHQLAPRATARATALSYFRIS
jgi:hypothetical protein